METDFITSNLPRRPQSSRRILFKELSEQVIGCAIEVHKTLGPGLLESAYEQCLAYELSKQKVPVKVQLPLPLQYKEIFLDCAYRIDLLIDDRLIVEVKSVDQLKNIDEAQLLTYMKLAKMRVGLLINFNVKCLKEGIRRFVLKNSQCAPCPPW